MFSRLASVAVFALAIVALPAFAGLHKCVHSDGKISYQQTECPEAADAAEIEPAPIPAATQEIDPKHWSVRSQAARMEKERAPPSEKPAKKANLIPRPQRTDIMNAIVGHEMIRGMNAEEVREALGPPNSTHKIRGDDLSWDYSGTDSKGRYRRMKLRFRDGLLDTWTQSGTSANETLETDRGRWMK